MHERTLGVHQIELVVNPGHDFRNRRAVRDHAARTHHLREVTTRHHGRRLVVDAALESSRGPVDELDRALGLDRRHRRIDLNGGQLNNPTLTLYLKALTLSNSKFRNDAFNYQIR